MTKGAFRGFQIFTACLLCLCLALGLWQLKRHFWKADLLAAAAAAATAAPVSMPLNSHELRAYQRVNLTGAFLSDQDIVIRGFAIEGVSGSRLYAPFRLQDGRIMIIQRGWAPRGQEGASHLTNISEQSLEIVWRPIEARVEAGGSAYALFDRVNVPDQGIWTHIDTHEIQDFWHYPNLIHGGYGELRAPQAAAQNLVIEEFRTDLFNRHLEYVITWWSLAAILLIIYIFVRRQRSGKQK